MGSSENQRTLRDELTEARDAIGRQLELLRHPFTPVGVRHGPPDTRSILAELERQLGEIDEALAGLDSTDA
jgi:hypothetical protein